MFFGNGERFDIAGWLIRWFGFWHDRRTNTPVSVSVSVPRCICSQLTSNLSFSYFIQSRLNRLLILIFSIDVDLFSPCCCMPVCLPACVPFLLSPSFTWLFFFLCCTHGPDTSVHCVRIAISFSFTFLFASICFGSFSFNILTRFTTFSAYVAFSRFMLLT